MRIVNKTNLALVGLVAISAVLNFSVLEFTIMPRFLDIEAKTAERNQSRAIEAIQMQTDQVAASSRDYAFWDDSYRFIQGDDPEYVTNNASAESLAALRVNFFLAIDAGGAVRLDKGFDFSAAEPAVIRLLQVNQVPPDHPFRHIEPRPESRQGLVRTDHGIIAVGYAPILPTERTGPARGTLVFGKVLALDALREATKVDFDLLPLSSGMAPVEGLQTTDDKITSSTVLAGLDGKPVAVLVSRTDRLISSAGRQALWVAMSLLAAGGILLILSLAVLLRRIVITRIEALRSHLMSVGATGALKPMVQDNRDDELSEAIDSFNLMASQLAELRERLRRQDYFHGAADEAAGILHNIRNALNPISTIVWELAEAEQAPWKKNVVKALEELEQPLLPADRADKLTQFVVLSTAKLLEESNLRKKSIETLVTMVRHVDHILKDKNAISQSARIPEAVELRSCIESVWNIIHGKPGIDFFSDITHDASVIGHKVALEQVFANLLVNAADAIEANGGGGVISVCVQETMHDDCPALDVQVRDNGDGIDPEKMTKIFERGFSTRRKRSSGVGLHWCANAINAMQGRLYAESAGVGCGTTIHVVLPKNVTGLRNAA